MKKTSYDAALQITSYTSDSQPRPESAESAEPQNAVLPGQISPTQQTKEGPLFKAVVLKISHERHLLIKAYAAQQGVTIESVGILALKEFFERNNHPGF